MSGPFWLAGILAALMLATAAYCATRLIIARAHRRRDERDVDLWAVMFGAGTGWFGWRAWRGRRGRADVTASGQPPHRHHVPHLVMCGAMVYMLLAAGAVATTTDPGIAMGGPSAAGRFPLLALVLAVFMVGYVMWQADRLPALAQASTERPGGPVPVTTLALSTTAGAKPASQPAATTPDPAPSPAQRVLSPRLAACCQIAMAATMGYMLILLL